ncbi:hypothetical protein ACQKML_11480 [Peribacillus frigoritolerans]
MFLRFLYNWLLASSMRKWIVLIILLDSVYVNVEGYQDELKVLGKEPECREAGEEMCGKRMKIVA